MPQRDLFIEKDSAINEHIEQMRLSATKSLLERRDVVIVASVSAIYGIGEPQALPPDGDDAGAGDKMGQRDVIGTAHPHAVPAQRGPTFSRGTFRVRGERSTSSPAEHWSWRSASSSSATRSSRLQLFDPLTGQDPAEDPALHGLSRAATT